MVLSERAGQPAGSGDPRRCRRAVAAYYDRRPDPADPAQRVAFGTSGHRGSSFRNAFNEAHILATTEAICRYRRPARLQRAAVHRPRHARAVRAGHPDRARASSSARGVDVRIDAADGYTPTPAVSHAIVVANRPKDSWRRLADGIVVTPSHNPPDDGGFKYNPPNGGPADTDVTRWIQDEANRILEAPGSRWARRHRPRRRTTRCRADGRAVRLPGPVRRRPDVGHRHGRDPHVRGCGSGSTRWAVPRSRTGAAIREPLRARPDGHQRDRRSDVRVHDRRLGRQDPDGPLVAVRDGPAGRAARPVRHRARQRCRRRPPRRGHAGGGPAEPEPLPVGRRSATCSAGPGRLGEPASGSARPWCRRR